MASHRSGVNTGLCINIHNNSSHIHLETPIFGFRIFFLGAGEAPVLVETRSSKFSSRSLFVVINRELSLELHCWRCTKHRSILKFSPLHPLSPQFLHLRLS